MWGAGGERFSQHMVAAADALLDELEGVYAYTQSDEISVLLLGADLFDRSVEKLVSVSAGIASSVFTHTCGEPAHFDSRIWLGTTVEDVVDYFSWRQADATRNALNGWCHWTLRDAGSSATEATKALEGMTIAGKNELLFGHGINFDADVPLWHRRGIGVRWETFTKEGTNPITGECVLAERRHRREDRELPMRDGYRAFVAELAALATKADT